MRAYYKASRQAELKRYLRPLVRFIMSSHFSEERIYNDYFVFQIWNRLRIAQEIQREQEEIEVELRDLEDRGVLIEKELRGEDQLPDL